MWHVRGCLSSLTVLCMANVSNYNYWSLYMYSNMYVSFNLSILNQYVIFVHINILFFNTERIWLGINESSSYHLIFLTNKNIDLCLKYHLLCGTLPESELLIVSVSYCCITNISTSQWLKTISIYFSHICRGLLIQVRPAHLCVWGEFGCDLSRLISRVTWLCLIGFSPFFETSRLV